MTELGALIAGRYRLVDRMAEDEEGSAWEAFDELLPRKVAVKQFLPQPRVALEDADVAQRRLVHEAWMTAGLHHPHVVSLYDVVEHDGGTCLIMQYVPSRSLNALLQDRGVLPKAAVLRIGAEVAAGLAAAHEVGIVHRDVTPANVLITEDGAATLTGFGFPHAGDALSTAAGTVAGTSAYCAPEVARGDEPSSAADVFSLGATLYAALEGSPPFGTDPDLNAVLGRVASGRITPPRRSGGLTPLLTKMLAVAPGDRPAMAEVASSLAAWQTEMETVSDPLPAPLVALPPRTLPAWAAETAPVAQGAAGPTADGPAESNVAAPLAAAVAPAVDGAGDSDPRPAPVESAVSTLPSAAVVPAVDGAAVSESSGVSGQSEPVETTPLQRQWSRRSTARMTAIRARRRWCCRRENPPCGLVPLARR